MTNSSTQKEKESDTLSRQQGKIIHTSDQLAVSRKELLPQTLPAASRHAAWTSLSRQVRYKPPVDAHAAVRLGDFLPQWIEKNILRPGSILNTITDLWLQLVPPHLLIQTSFSGLAHRVLTVYTSSATAKMELDAMLRQGLFRQVQTASRGTIARVRTTVNRSAFPQ